MAVKIIIGADTAPTATNEDKFKEGNAAELFTEQLLEKFESVDWLCLNLETTLTNAPVTAKYPGPYLTAKPENVAALKKINNLVLNTGNNHTLDCGEAGIKETIETLKKAGIQNFGAGADINEASKPYIFKKDGITIGILSLSEYGCSHATQSTAGANPYDPLTSFESVAALSAQCDKVIVLYHGGREFYRYPTPNLQKICRKLADSGADVVICQHSHCVGCYEQYGATTIVYGQGNVLLDRNENEYKKTAILVEIDIDTKSQPTTDTQPATAQVTDILPTAAKTADILPATDQTADTQPITAQTTDAQPGDMRISYIPLCKNNAFVRLASTDEAKMSEDSKTAQTDSNATQSSAPNSAQMSKDSEAWQILHDFDERSAEIMKPGFIDAEFAKMAEGAYKGFVYKLMGSNKLLRMLNKISGGKFYEKIYNDKDAAAVLNILTASNHAEALAEGLKHHV